MSDEKQKRGVFTPKIVGIGHKHVLETLFEEGIQSSRTDHRWIEVPMTFG